MADAPFIPVAITVTGAYLAWFGVHYWRSDVTWPSDPIKAVLTGKPLPDNSKTVPRIPGFPVAPMGPGPQPTGPANAGPQINGPVPQQTPGPVVPAPTGPGPTAPPPPAGTLSKQQITALWVANGGDVNTSNTAAAIALAESSGRVAVTSTNPDGGTNVGLWQLDTKGVGSGYTIKELSDAATNARVTIMGSHNGNNWGAWETYTNGTYKQFL